MQTLLKLPGLKIREPLLRRPFAGACIGGLAGLFFGVMAAFADAFPADARSVAFGYTLGGLAAGAIVGVFAPEFRSRWLACVIVGAAMVVGLLIAVPLWGEDWGAPLTVLTGCFGGIVYAGLCWDYESDKEPIQSAPRGE